jgi:hypothetical protein
MFFDSEFYTMESANKRSQVGCFPETVFHFVEISFQFINA